MKLLVKGVVVPCSDGVSRIFSGRERANVLFKHLQRVKWKWKEQKQKEMRDDVTVYDDVHFILQRERK